MSKHYIIINLNKAESAETRLERIREQVRWGVFGVLILLLISVNFQIWMISNGYNDIISQKKGEIGRLKDKINKLKTCIENTKKNLDNSIWSMR